MDGTASDAVHDNPGIVQGHMGIVNGGYAGTHAHEIVGAESIEFNVRVADLICAVAGDQDTVEGLFAAGDPHILRAFAVRLSPAQERRHGLGLRHLIAGNHQRISKLFGTSHRAHQSVGRHMVQIRDTQDNVPCIGSRNNGTAYASDGHGHKLTRGRLNASALLHSQTIQTHGFSQKPCIRNGFLYHIRAPFISNPK